MSAKSHGEKKGIIPARPEEIEAQTTLYQIMSSIASSTPKVKEFTIARKPVLASVLADAADENVEPMNVKNVMPAKSLVLMRAEKPLMFDVVELTRNIKGEANLAAHKQFVEAEEEVEENGDGGGASDEGEQSNPDWY